MKFSALLFVCIFAILAVAYFGSGVINAGEEGEKLPCTITFTAKNGDVAFDHAKHLEAEKGCKACHHTMKEGETPKKCVACHLAEEEKDGAPVRKKAFHDQCKGCHKKLFTEKKLETN